MSMRVRVRLCVCFFESVTPPKPLLTLKLHKPNDVKDTGQHFVVMDKGQIKYFLCKCISS